MARLRNGIDFQSNWLFIDRQLLTVEETSPAQLKNILELGSQAIEHALDMLYEETKRRRPDGEIHYPWLQAIQLCRFGDEAGILTSQGLQSPYAEISKTVHEVPEDIVEVYHPYWQAPPSIFERRVISHMEGWDESHDDTWLQVRPRGKD